ncbi:MAG: transglycosylase SLT domain-containing protein [Asticcacaulis sp.]
MNLSPSALAEQAARVAKPVGNTVMSALQHAATATGVDFNYLVKTATRESSLNPNARAPTSSAAGLFQFIEQTWLGTLKTHGAKHGYGNYAAQITQGADGRYRVGDPQARKQVLGLRYDANASAVMGAELTAGHAAYLKGRIGRDPTQGELYAAHFLGPAGAAGLISANQTRPTALAASLFPAAARANHNIFYKQGHALSVRDVIANLTRTGGNATVTITPLPDIVAPSGNLLLAQRMDKVRSDQAIMDMVFGSSDGQKGLLFATQLLSAFGPEDTAGEGDKKDEDGMGQAFGSLLG